MTVLLDMLALGVMIPVLPRLVIEFLGGDSARAATIYGLFGAVWAAMQFVFSPVAGALADRYGRRPVILASNLGLGLDYVLIALAPSLAWLLVGRVLPASRRRASAPPVPTSPTSPARGAREARFGLVGAAFGVGFILGPAVGGVLGSIDLRLRSGWPPGCRWRTRRTVSSCCRSRSCIGGGDRGGDTGHGARGEGARG